MHDWPHAPSHRLGSAGAYIVTAGTYRKEPLFRSRERLDFLLEQLFERATEQARRCKRGQFFRIIIALSQFSRLPKKFAP